MSNEKQPKEVLPQESDMEASVREKYVDETPNSIPEQHTFPEGGLRAWCVAAGCAGILFSGFGYVNAFGYVPLLL